MAVVNILQPAFGIKWAQDGTVESIDEAQWRAGWSFIGATPPSVEQFNKVHQVQDEKSNWLYQQMLAVFAAGSETPTVGDLNSLRDSIDVVARLAGGNVAGYSQVTTTQTLNATHIGKLVDLAGASPISVTLPAAAGLRVGSRISVANRGNSTATIISQNGNIVGVNMPVIAGLLNYPMLAGVSSDFIWSGTAWHTVMGSAFGIPGLNSYQKFPNGLILQWGRGQFAAVAGDIVTVNLPISFPTQVLVVVASCATLVGAGGVSNPPDIAAAPTANPGQIQVQQMTNVVYPANFHYYAIGN